MLCLHCQEAASQSPAPSLIPVLGKGLECVSHPQSPLLFVPSHPHWGGKGQKLWGCAGPGAEQGDMDVHTQTKEQEIFPAWLILLQPLCPETRQGWHQISQRRKGGLAGMMLHQVSPAAPSLNLTSWGSRQWLLVPFPKTSVSWNGMLPPQPTTKL